MNKKFYLIALVLTITVAAGAVIWFLLRPMTQPANAPSGIMHDAAWKSSLTEGSWVSEDGALTLDIAGTDFTLKVNGVYACLGSFRFDDSGTVGDPSVRFDMQIKPESALYPDADGAVLYEVTGLWHEGDAIFISAAPLNTAECLPVPLSKVEAAAPVYTSD